MSKITASQFNDLSDTQQAAVLTYAKTRSFLADTDKADAAAAIIAHAEQIAENEQLVQRLTHAYTTKRANARNPLAILSSFGL